MLCSPALYAASRKMKSQIIGTYVGFIWLMWTVVGAVYKVFAVICSGTHNKRVSQSIMLFSPPRLYAVVICPHPNLFLTLVLSTLSSTD